VLRNVVSRSVEASVKEVGDPPEADRLTKFTHFFEGRCLPVCKVWWRLLWNCRA